MMEKSFNLLHTLKPRRDAYGFALRPQHLQRYREYTNFYKEEEGERSDKWKKFLEQQAKSAQPSSSEEQKETLQAQPHSTGEEHKECSSEEEDKEILQAQPCSSEEQKETLQVQPRSPKEEHKECSSEEEHKETLQVQPHSSEEQQNETLQAQSRSPEEEHKETSQVQPRSSEEQQKETSQAQPHSSGEAQKETLRANPCSSEEEHKETLPAEATEWKAETLSEGDREGDDSSGRKFASDGSTESDPEKEFQLTQETKTHKVQTWAQIRPSLCVIESMMNFRVKRKNMKDELTTVSGDHLPSIEERGSSGGASEEDVEEDVCVNETLDNNVNASRAESAVRNGVSSKPFFPWKEELEFLVHGGVPKDLRGEVWQAFVGVNTRRVERYYQNLVAQETNTGESKEQDNASGVPKKWKRQIEKDIPRTFPGHPALDEDGRDSLRRVLLAYALHNPNVGYCQAMNFFAGILLLLMPEENAFWALVGIIDDYFDGYYTEEMIESQVDQLVFEELIRERFPKLVNHLDYLGVQVAWISAPWFLSIFVNMLPWESVLRVWDVLLFEGNRVMLFRTALALMELYGPALVTTKDAGDAITLLQTLAGSTFDSSQLVLTACMGFLAVTEARLLELREKHRSAVLVVVEERSKGGRVWKDSKGLASKLYSFKHDPGSRLQEKKATEGLGDTLADGDISNLESRSFNLDDVLSGLTVDSEVDSLPDLQEQVVWLKVELCRLLEEKRSAILRAEELETAFMEMVKQDNQRQLSARVEQLEQEVDEVRQALADKKEQEAAMLKVLMRVEQEQRVTEDARIKAEQDAAAQRYAVHVLQEKYEKAMALISEMEKRVVMAESTLEATLQYQSGQVKALSSPRSVRNQGSMTPTTPTRKIGLLPFGLGWRDRNKSKPTNVEESSESKSTNEGIQ